MQRSGSSGEYQACLARLEARQMDAQQQSVALDFAAQKTLNRVIAAHISPEKTQLISTFLSFQQGFSQAASQTRNYPTLISQLRSPHLSKDGTYLRSPIHILPYYGKISDISTDIAPAINLFINYLRRYYHYRGLLSLFNYFSSAPTQHTVQSFLIFPPLHSETGESFLHTYLIQINPNRCFLTIAVPLQTFKLVSIGSKISFAEPAMLQLNYDLVLSQGEVSIQTAFITFPQDAWMPAAITGNEKFSNFILRLTEEELKVKVLPFLPGLSRNSSVDSGGLSPALSKESSTQNYESLSPQLSIDSGAAHRRRLSDTPPPSPASPFIHRRRVSMSQLFTNSLANNLESDIKFILETQCLRYAVGPQPLFEHVKRSVESFIKQYPFSWQYPPELNSYLANPLADATLSSTDFQRNPPLYIVSERSGYVEQPSRAAPLQEYIDYFNRYSPGLSLYLQQCFHQVGLYDITNYLAGSGTAIGLSLMQNLPLEECAPFITIPFPKETHLHADPLALTAFLFEIRSHKRHILIITVKYRGIYFPDLASSEWVDYKFSEPAILQLNFDFVGTGNNVQARNAFLSFPVDPWVPNITLLNHKSLVANELAGIEQLEKVKFSKFILIPGLHALHANALIKDLPGALQFFKQPQFFSHLMR